MSVPSDPDLHEIVRRVVRRTVSGAGQSAPPVPDEDAFQVPQAAEASPEARLTPAPRQGAVALGADHGGYALKEVLKTHLQDQGYNVIDCGTHSEDSVDYPDFAAAVARLVSDGQAWRGVIVDGAGIGSCMVANKFQRVRAAMCYDHASAVNSREHNNANVLTLGAGLVGGTLARQILDVWLVTSFGGGRHARRVDKITALDDRR